MLTAPVSLRVCWIGRCYRFITYSELRHHAGMLSTSPSTIFSVRTIPGLLDLEIIPRLAESK